MPKRIFIRDGGLTSSVPTPTGYTVIGSDNGTPKKQIQSTISNLGGFTHYIGEEYGGGIIYYLWMEQDGEHGLIVDTTDLSYSKSWSNITNAQNGATSSYNGLGNSNTIVSQFGHTDSAAKLCLDSTKNGYTDWYLPSIEELRLIYGCVFHLNKKLEELGGDVFLVNWIGTPNSFDYLSSTEYNNTNFMYHSFYDGSGGAINKAYTFRVRAIRKF